MRLIRDLTQWPAAARSGAVAIGNFDGVHLGHARIVETLIAKAREVGGPAVILTFDPHPVRILRPDQCPPPLTWTERKAELLRDLGVEWMIVYPTDEALLELAPEAFFNQILLEKLEARAVVEGPNFFFGRDRAGTIEVLRELCNRAALPLTVVAPYELDGQYVSSSRVRKLIADGDCGDACRMLTRPYRIRGMVTHGAGRGAKIGFPTANLQAVDTLVPGQGVYAGRAWRNGTMSPAAVNIGPNPTFGEQQLKVEVHLIDHQGPLYGRPLEVDFLARLRDIQRFPSVEALKEQLARDVQRAAEIAADP